MSEVASATVGAAGSERAKPRLVEIKGMSGFSGKCDAGDWGASRRF